MKKERQAIGDSGKSGGVDDEGIFDDDQEPLRGTIMFAGNVSVAGSKNGNELKRRKLDLNINDLVENEGSKSRRRILSMNLSESRATKRVAS